MKGNRFIAAMKRNRFIAAALSLLIPGLGQIYGGKGARGAAILAGALVIGNLNLLFLLAFAIADPDPQSIWAYWIPRIGHDLMAVWSIAFWICNFENQFILIYSILT